jgi:hypothetical protein
VKKVKIILEDGRYLIYYAFAKAKDMAKPSKPATKEGKADVRA